MRRSEKNIYGLEDRAISADKAVILDLEVLLSEPVPVYKLVGLNSPFGNSDSVLDAKLGYLLGLPLESQAFTAEVSRARLSSFLEKLLSVDKSGRKALIVLNKEDRHFFCYELNMVSEPQVFCRDSANNDLLIPMAGESKRLLEEIADCLAIIEALKELNFC